METTPVTNLPKENKREELLTLADKRFNESQKIYPNLFKEEFREFHKIIFCEAFLVGEIEGERQAIQRLLTKFK